MKKNTTHYQGIIPIFSFLIVLFQFFSGSRALAQVSVSGIHTANGIGSVVNSLTSVPAGALLVLVTTGESDNSNPCNVTSLPSLTWTRRSNAHGLSSGDAEIWTAVFTAGGNISITSAWQNTDNQSSVCYIITGQESVPGGASASAYNQGAPSVNITTTRANSIIIGGISDWNAVNGNSRVYRDASVTESFYRRVNGAFTTYSFYRSASSVGTYTEGLSSPTAQSSGTVLYEVRGPVVPDTIPPTAPTLGSPLHSSSTIMITMTGSTDNVGVAGYDVYIAGFDTLFNVPPTYVITGLAGSTQYSIFAKAKDTSGNASAASNTITVTTDPAIEGFGANAVGGSNDTTIYHVTNLNNSGPGSLSYGVFFAQPSNSHKTIVFDVSGTIVDRIDLTGQSYLTIDASGRNVTIDNNMNGNAITIEGKGSHHIILKNLHIMNAGNDGIGVADSAHDVAIVNCTVYGSVDGNIDISGDAYNVTVQYCIIGNGNPSYFNGDMLITAHKVTVHHNLFSPATANRPGERCPFVHANYSIVGSPNADIRNNLIWKYGRDGGTGSGYGTAVGYNATANVVNNYYYSVGTPLGNAVDTSDGYDSDSSGTGKIYANGNVSGNIGVNPNSFSNHSEWTIPVFATVTTQDACDAMELVLANAGPSVRNAADSAYIDSVSLIGCSIPFSNPGKPAEVKLQPEEQAKQRSAWAVTGIFPNPARSRMNVIINAPKADDVTVIIMDISGKIIKRQQVNTVTGPNTIPVNVSSLAQGTYLLKVACKFNCETAISRFVKL